MKCTASPPPSMSVKRQLPSNSFQPPLRLHLGFGVDNITAHGTILVPDSSLSGAYTGFPEYVLDNLIRLNDPHRQETFLHACRAMQTLGFSAPKLDQ